MVSLRMTRRRDYMPNLLISLTPEPLKNFSRFSRQTDSCTSGVILMLFTGTSSNYFTPGVNIIKRFSFDTDRKK